MVAQNLFVVGVFRLFEIGICVCSRSVCSFWLEFLSNHLLQLHQPFQLLLKISKTSWMFWLQRNILLLTKLSSKRIFIRPVTLQNEFGFFKTFSNTEVKYKNNFIISLSYTKYRFYFLIGSNYIMHLNITFHILLHPLNMHARLHQGQKTLYGTSPVDLQLNLNIHLWEISR